MIWFPAGLAMVALRLAGAPWRISRDNGIPSYQPSAFAGKSLATVARLGAKPLEPLC